MKKDITRKIAYIGIGGALVFLLGSFELFHLPQGGGVSLYSLPIIYISVVDSLSAGVWVAIIGAIFSFLKNAIMVNPFQILLDYFFPNMAFVFTGFFRGAKWRFMLGIIVAYSLNFLFHFSSGVFFFLKGPWNKRIIASFFYNISYTLPELLLVLLAFNFIYSKVLKRWVENAS